MSSSLDPRLPRVVSMLAPEDSPPRHFVAETVLAKLPALPAGFAASAAAWSELARETDPEFFFAGLRGLADHAQSEGRLEWAAAVFAEIAVQPLAGPDAARARSRLDAIVGRGAFGGRFEFLANRFVHDASDYRTIVPMLAGSAVFRLVSGAALGRLAATAGGAWYRRGVGTRFAAGLLGFAAEVPVFSFTNRGLRAWSGDAVAWDGDSLGRDLLATTITLGALKGADYLGRRSLATLSGSAMAVNRPLLQKVQQAVIPQTAMFLGLMSAHRLEESLGLRPHVDGATTVTDTLASMFSLGAGAHLAHRLLGSHHTQWQAELGLRAALLSDGGRPSVPLSLRPAFATAGPGPLAEMSVPEFFQRPPANVMMSESGGINRVGGPSPALELRPYQREYLEAASAAMRRAAEPGVARDPQKPVDRGYILSPFQTGKSLIIGPLAEAAREIFPGKRTLVLSPLKIVQRQIREDLAKTFSGTVSVFDAREKNLDGDVVVASVFSLASHLERAATEFPASQFGLVVVDEMTSVLAESWQRIMRELGFVDGVGNFRVRPGRFVLGLGGTGEREDGRHVREFFGTTFLAGRGLNWFVREGYLHDVAGLEVPYGNSEADFERLEESGESLIVMRNTPGNRERILDTYAEHLHGKRAMVFVESIQHAQDLAKDFNRRFGHGYAAAVTGKSSDGQTEAALDRFDRGEAKVLVSVRKLAVGFRARETHGILHGYQTTSWNLFAQRSSRALARQPGEPQREVLIITMEGGLKPLARVQNAATLFGNYDGYPRGQRYRPMEEPPPAPRQTGQLRLRRGLFAGEGEREISAPAGTVFFAQALRGVLRRQFGGDLLRMCELAGIPLYRGDAMMQGALPETRGEVEALARHLNVSSDWLAEAWLRDRLAGLELEYPLPNSMKSGRATLTRLLRKAVLQQEDRTSLHAMMERQGMTKSDYNRFRKYFRGEFSTAPQVLKELQGILLDSRVADPEVIRAVIADFLEEEGHASAWLDEEGPVAPEQFSADALADPSSLGVSSASIEVAQGPEAVIEFAWKRSQLESALSKLSDSDRKLLELRYGMNGNSGETLRELGEGFGRTIERMRQKEKKALERLRGALRLYDKDTPWYRPMDTSDLSEELGLPLGRLGLSSVSFRILRENGVRTLGDIERLPTRFFDALGSGGWFVQLDVLRVRNRIGFLKRVLSLERIPQEALGRFNYDNYSHLEKMWNYFMNIRIGNEGQWEPLAEEIQRHPELGVLILPHVFRLRRSDLSVRATLLLRSLAERGEDSARALLALRDPEESIAAFSEYHPYAAFIVRVLSEWGNLKAKRIWENRYRGHFIELPVGGTNWSQSVMEKIKECMRKPWDRAGILIWPKPWEQFTLRKPAYLEFTDANRGYLSIDFFDQNPISLESQLPGVRFKPDSRENKHVWKWWRVKGED